ncbi:DUF1697 domain-containing protein [Gillisia sp. M10.2A]|uniref:DUF1697 domain-containing protein n=1 Tax=Gillisia lutea TaxID=2909668 RepID=A0ABS9EC15_9FLAO|nr:DUF1697 domain-containing protein [Gillisia lutea]MCF4100382.1 DUF1697 domain-containing protein [Gillisia lutea]
MNEPKKIAILRGINVGGKRKILMADLKMLCEKLELQEVKTYIQSGNLIFSSHEQNSDIENKLEKTISDEYGFEVPVIVRTSTELLSLVNKNPFYNSKADINKLHITFLKFRAAKEDIDHVLTCTHEPDRFIIDGKEVFLYCEGKYHQSKLTNNFFEKKLKVPATTRNWKTILKLLELSKY